MVQTQETQIDITCTKCLCCEYYIFSEKTSGAIFNAELKKTLWVWEYQILYSIKALSGSPDTEFQHNGLWCKVLRLVQNVGIGANP